MLPVKNDFIVAIRCISLPIKVIAINYDDKRYNQLY